LSAATERTAERSTAWYCVNYVFF